VIARNKLDPRQVIITNRLFKDKLTDEY